MVKFIFISGPPGSGKNTQAKLISEEFGFSYFDSGDMIRSHIKDGTIEGEGEMGKGLLMPIKPVLVLAKKELSKLIKPGGGGIIISGIPRSIDQAFGIEGEEGIINWLSESYERYEILFINLHIPEEESINRNMKRNEGRVDDKLDVLKTRLEVFKKETFPVYSELKQRGYRVVEINGMQSRQEVFEEIKKNIV